MTGAAPTKITDYLGSFDFTTPKSDSLLGEFEAKWDNEYLPIGQSWRRNWSRLPPFFDYPPEIRNVIYTTNAIESVNMG